MKKLLSKSCKSLVVTITALTMFECSANAETFICGKVQATVSIATGEQYVLLTSPNNKVYNIVSGPTESLDVQAKLNNLKESAQPELLCVKTIYPVIKGTILATGFTPYETF
ncbi:MAG: hypothetical protein ACXVCY_08890 [Pseudobdellovibrionaceae bacterium]